MTLGKRGLVGALLALVLAGGGAFAKESLFDDFQLFLRRLSLQEWYDAKRTYPAPWHQNLLGLRYLSTREYVVVGGTYAEVYGEKDSRELYAYAFRVFSVAPDSFGRELARMFCSHDSDGARLLERFWAYNRRFESMMQVHLVSLWFNQSKPLKEVGEWALINDKPDGKKGWGPDVIFCRNGVIVESWGEDFGDFQYLPFLQKIDALLQRDPARPAPAPEGFSEAEYQKTVEKVKAWEKVDAERRAKEAEEKRQKWERELAQRRAEAARARASARQPEPPRGDASADCACPVPAPRAKAPRQGGHWLWRLLKGGCQ